MRVYLLFALVTCAFGMAQLQAENARLKRTSEALRGVLNAMQEEDSVGILVKEKMLGQATMNGEEYCESDAMISNKFACKASSCCHWNTWEEGEASFNGEGRCWSSITTDTCYDIAVNGEEYCESDAMISNEIGCKSSSCCHWNTWEEGEASFNREGRCWSSISTDMCYDTAMNGEAYCENYMMISNEDGCKSSSCCHWNTWEEGEASFNGKGRCWSSITTDMCYDTQAITWQHVGHGGCADGPWRKIGTAGSADEAKALMLVDDQCHADQSMLFYSSYSYDSSWGVRCTTGYQYEDCNDDNTNWQEYILRRVTWKHVGSGGCSNGPWRKIGTADSLDEAKALMLADDECNANQSVLFYSPSYSYDSSWSVRCVTAEQYEECNDHNTNWQEYIVLM